MSVQGRVLAGQLSTEESIETVVVFVVHSFGRL